MTQNKLKELAERPTLLNGTTVSNLIVMRITKGAHFKSYFIAGKTKAPELHHGGSSVKQLRPLI